MEEPRQDLVTVLGREDLRELDDARHAKPPVAQRVDDLRESLDEPRGSLPVERRPAREPELPVQEVESEACPSSSHSRFRSKSARATKNSASAARSRWRSSARRAERSRAEIMTRASHAISAAPQAYAFASGSANESGPSRTPSRAFGAREARSGAPGAAFPLAPESRRSSDGEVRQAPRRREIGARRRREARGWPQADHVTTPPAHGDVPAAALLVARPRSPSGSAPRAYALFVRPHS